MPTLKLKDNPFITGFRIGQTVQVGGRSPFEIFDIKGNEILVGEPGKPPRQSKRIQCDPGDHKPRHYIEHDGELCRVDIVNHDSLVISRRVRL